MPPTVKGRIVEWSAEKSYGFVRTGRMRVFLHSRDFAEKRKSPAVGDRVRFVMGTDSKGRACATRAAHLGNGGELTLNQCLALAGLLGLPVLAGLQLAPLLPVPSWALPVYAIAISLTAFAAYGWDKHRARNQGWRVAESSLHFLELLGGWPGAFLAQRAFRHKVSKRWFQCLFWLIVAGYQCVALDFLLNWKISMAVREWIQRGV